MTEKARKELTEKRASLIEEMTTLTDTVATETRAFTEEEQTKFDSMTKEVENIDSTLKAAEQTRALSDKVVVEVKQESQEEMETRAFANIIRQRADQNITKTDNGAVIPTTIAKKIIDKIYDLSPVFGSAEKFNVTGKVAIPYVDASNDNIAVAYANEFTDLEAKSVKLLTTTLDGYLAGVLAKISRSLMNDTDINLTQFVINKIASAASRFIDKEVLIGTSGSIEGMRGLDASQITTSVATGAITMDELITVKDSIKTAYQRGAYWVMHPSTLDAIRHLKDQTLRYYVNDDVTNDFGATLLGKPVYTSDMMDEIGASKNVVYYGDFSQGLAGKVVEDSVQILNEKYATQHAVGVVAWLELDCKIQNQQALAGLKMHA